MRTTVFVVEDHPIMREGYESLIRLEADLDLVGSAGSADEAMSQITDLKPDVVVMDLQLPGMSGVELIKQLIAFEIPGQILVVSAHDEDLYGERTLRAGARGYLMKDESARSLVDAVRKVGEGGLYISGALEKRLVGDWVDGADRALSPTERLSDRELEVFELLGRGRTTRQVAETLNLSVKTIESHRANLKKKLNIKTAPDLVRQAVLWVQSPMMGP